MFLSDLSIKRPIMVSMGLIVFLLFGGLAYVNMSLDLTPNVEVPYISIQTVYAGASPRDIEMQVTKKIEDAVSSVSRIEKITSYSMEGVSFINIEFQLDKDVNIANQEVKDKIDAILNDLPDDAESPVVQKLNIQEFPIIDVVLTGDIPLTELWDIADKKLKNRLSQIPGVGRVDITGGEEREIQVVLDNRTVFQNRISLQQLSQVLAAENLNMPGGSFKKRGQEYTVRLNGEFTSLDQLSGLEVPTPHGNKRLCDIADIRDTGAEVTERTSYFNNVEKIGNPDAVLLSLVKTADGNTVEISDQVRELLPGIQSDLPPGCKLDIAKDKSVFVVGSVNDTLSNIILGILLTGLVLLFFVHDVRSTIIVAVAMPMSILSAFMVMDMSGFSLNIMSLMGLSTSVGILVTNSVVVLENIFRHKNMGHDRRTAAAVGTSEIVVAVLASALTNIAVFLPIATMQSIMGRFFQQFALTVTYATVFSLLISFTLTPMMASMILPEHSKKKKSGIGEMLERLFTRMERVYARILEGVLKNKKRGLVIVAVSVALFVASLPLAGRIGSEFMPMMDEGDIRIEVELPLGYSLKETGQTLQIIEDRLKQYPEVRHILTTLGSTSQTNVGPNLAVAQIKLVDASKRSMTTNQMSTELIRGLSSVSNARIRVTPVSSIAGGDRPQLTFTLMGQDIDSLEVYKRQILNRISDVPGLNNLNTSSRSGKPEISIVPDLKKITDAGLTVYEVALALRGSLTGLVTTQYKDEGEEYDIRVMLSDESVDTPEEVGNIAVVGASGTYTLSQLGQVKFAEGYSKIEHTDKYKSIEFTGSPAPGFALGDVMNEIDVRTADIEFPLGYKINWGGFSKMMKEAIVDMAFTFLIAIILTYMLLAAILESLTQPLLVLGTVPLALIGVLGALYVTGMTLNIISMMAIVMLLGIVVNNAILILDYTNILVREQGKDVRTALLEAAPTKLKAILMSTLAIIIGMLPMALGYGDAGREFRQPMGVVSIGGLVVSTVLTLIVIPALYNLISKSKQQTVITAKGQEV